MISCWGTGGFSQVRRIAWWRLAGPPATSQHNVNDRLLGTDPRKTLAVQMAKVRKLGFRMKWMSPSYPTNKMLPGFISRAGGYLARRRTSRTFRYRCHPLPIILTAVVVSVGFNALTVTMHHCLSRIFAPTSVAMQHSVNSLVRVNVPYHSKYRI